LVVLVPLMLAAGWIAGLVRLPLSEYWPHLLLAMLAAFLALQVVPKLILPAEARRGGRETGRGDPAGRSPDDSAD
ncbi:MAG TPA: hypothetical protein VEQ85_06090, partial [Lacipirellulaceae bacterium]|nr:hypothetical protein [Lacipirellulaceae bacterium]